MGVSFTWRPINPNSGISFASGSSLNKALEEAFGPMPIILSNTHIERLNGMIACGYDDLQEIITAIGDHEIIEIQSNW